MQHHDMSAPSKKPQYTLAVVGFRKCGKTALMRRLLFGLSDHDEFFRKELKNINNPNQCTTVGDQWEKLQTSLENKNGLFISILALKKLCSTTSNTPNFDPFYRFPKLMNDRWNSDLLLNLFDMPSFKGGFQKTVMKGLSLSDGVIFMIDCGMLANYWKTRHCSKKNLDDIWNRIVTESLHFVYAYGNMNDLIVVLNKMDLVSYSQEFFIFVERRIYSTLQEKCCSFGMIRSISIIPISILDEENIENTSNIMKEWKSMNLLQCVRNLKSPAWKPYAPLRMIHHRTYSCMVLAQL
ncbi:hypothetical protein FDP41_006745 [Naegleria fowleri]|uniref:Tr-type G domain-containing protein n=1 Tax=Naegleria fowleri TaxID=5763 RepID=A0A6A5BKI1_NAEFO|nr:uncharacterized protein FDP41_006745 [Naegleria fowleri]KAF0974135.1 hypothetical protein FDP41_006745 [Naegleria fowleri]